MKKISFLITLLIVLSLVGNSKANLSNSSIIHVKTNEYDEGINDTLLSSSYSQLFTLNRTYEYNLSNNSIIFENNYSNSTFNISTEYIEEDLLDFQDDFIENLNSSISTYDTFINNKTGFSLKKNNTINSNYFQYNINRNFGINDTLKMKVNKLMWVLDSLDLAHSSIEFSFLGAKLYFMLDFSDIYSQFVKNSTDALYFTSKNNIIDYQFSKLLNYFNLTTIHLDYIAVNSYYNKIHNFSLDIDYINIISNTDTLHLLVDNQEIISDSFFNITSFKGQPINLSLPSRFSADLKISEKFIFSLENEIVYNFNESGLLFRTSNFSIPDVFTNYSLYINIHPNVKDPYIVINNISYSIDENTPIIEFQNPFSIGGKIILINKIVQVDEIYQNETFIFSKFSNTSSLSFIYLNSSESIIGESLENGYQYSIPFYWPRGNILRIDISNSFKAQYQELTLEKSPSTYSQSSSYYEIEGKDIDIQFNMYNLTSSNRINPDLIKSYYNNGTLRSINGGSGITLEADEFNQGNFTLKVSLIKENFIDSNFIIIINKQPIQTEIQFIITRNSIDEVFIIIDFVTYENWDVNILMQIKVEQLINNTEVFSQKSELFMKGNWDNTSLTFSAHIDFGAHSGEFNFATEILPFYNQTTQIQNSIIYQTINPESGPLSNFLPFTLVSSTLIIVIRIVYSKISQEELAF